MELDSINKKEKGFTLIELLVVITIVGIVVSASMPIFRTLIESTETNVIVDELAKDLNMAKITAMSNAQSISFTLTEQDGVKQWVIENNNKDLKKKTFENNDIDMTASQRTFVFTAIGFIKDNSGNTLTDSSITICNNIIKQGTKIKFNIFGNIEYEEIECN